MNIITITAMKDDIKTYMAQDYDNELEVWSFVNACINECYSFQIYAVIDELDDDSLREIIKHFGI